MGEANAAVGSVKVLVVEDNADDRELLLRQLRKSGLGEHVKFISDGKEALDLLTGDGAPHPDDLIMILLDLRLPSLSGLELLRRLRALPRYQSVPVTVMTSSNDPRDLEECRRLRVVNYLNKPVTFDSFSKAVADVFHPPKSASEPAAGA
jgi:two-component system response regulator